LNENCISVKPFSLLGTNALDCNLLIIAGPRDAMLDAELEKIDKYFAQGGRAMILLNSASIDKETGKEKSGLDRVLAKWGVQIGNQIIQDPQNQVLSVHNMVERNFNEKHPLVNSLLGSPGLYLVKPRAMGKAKTTTQTADAPRVDELVFTGPGAIAGGSGKPQSFPLAVAVEKGAIQGVITERGATRLVVVGESLFLCDGIIDSALNRDFAAAAIDWLVNRAQLLEGIGPRPIKAYRIIMSHSQWQKAQWLLLAGLPGSVLTLGGLVWLRRRK
jgi:LPXTG-motif cell wall-anchored protein